jgi:CheY-like chemotaxis protein
MRARQKNTIREQRAGAAKAPERALILVVESEPAVRRLFLHFLSGGGFDVLTAADAFEGLENVQESGRQLDLLVTDVIMPGAMSGSTFAARLRRDNPDLKVLFTSGYSAGLLISEGSLAADSHFLQKPFHPDALLETVRDALKLRTRPNQNQTHYAQTTTR